MIAQDFGPGCGAVLRRQAAWRPSAFRLVVKFDGTVQAIAVFSDCSNLGLVAMPERDVAAFRFELLLRTVGTSRRRVV